MHEIKNCIEVNRIYRGKNALICQLEMICSEITCNEILKQEAWISIYSANIVKTKIVKHDILNI